MSETLTTSKYDQCVDDAIEFLTEFIPEVDGKKTALRVGLSISDPLGGHSERMWHDLLPITAPVTVFDGGQNIQLTHCGVLSGVARSMIDHAHNFRNDVYVSPYPHPDQPSRGGSVPLSLRHIHADIDGPVDLTTVKTVGAMAVASGSSDDDGVPHAHVYVRLTRDLAPHEHKALCIGLANFVGDEHADKSKHRPNDMLRVPGTLNWKNENDPRPVEWLVRPSDNTVKTWVPEKLAGILGVELSAEGAKATFVRNRSVEAAPGPGRAWSRVLSAFEDHGKVARVRSDGQVRVHCPGPNHSNGDRNPSADITWLEDRVLFHCFAGCDTRDVLDAVGLTWADLFDCDESDLTSMTIIDGDDAGGDNDAPGASWGSVPLAGLVAKIEAGETATPKPDLGELELCPADHAGALFYSGKVNMVFGESGSGKTWTALAVVAQQLAAGARVVYVDLEDSAAGIVDRLLSMGVSSDQVLGGLHYVSPAEGLGAAGLERFAALLDEVLPTLVIIDSTGEALSLEGASPNADDEVARWFRLLPRKASRHESAPAVVLLDHVVKSKDERGLWPIGSQRKRAAIDGAAYKQEVKQSFNRTTPGSARLICAKDRVGHYLLNQKVAELTVNYDADPEKRFVMIASPDGSGAAPANDTALEDAVYKYLAEHADDPSARTKNKIRDNVTGNARAVGEAADRLVAKGVAQMHKGSRNAHIYELVKP